MRHEKLKVSKIIDELVNYFLNLGCSDINVNIKDMGRNYEIKFRVYKECISQKEFIKLKKLLTIGKQEEMEEYYWALTGDCDVDTELSIVGMMSDSVEIENLDDDNLEITILRYK